MDIENKIKKKLGNSEDYLYKKITVNKKEVLLIYNEVLTSTSLINDFILRELINLKSIDQVIDNTLPDNHILKIKEKDIINYLNNGFLVLITKDIFAIEVREYLDTGVRTSNNELSIRGPKDAFNENYNTNLGLIRRRIKDSNLWCQTYYLGTRTNTKTGLLYIKDIVNMKLVKEVERILKSINLDAIIDSSYLIKRLDTRNNTTFPTIISTERPDKAAMALLEGKVVIILDTSPTALILPNLFIDYFKNTDDYYQKNIHVSFIRILRIIAFYFTIFIPAGYIALTTHNQNLLPLDILLSLKLQRSLVPFSTITEAIFMSICFEILKESDIRMSMTTGSSISILGGLILGDAAVAAGIISPIMIIVIAISSISGLVFSDIELINATRIWRFIFLIMAALFGLNGIFIATIILFLRLITIKSFNIPYLYPFIPTNIKEWKDAVIKTKYNNRNPIFTKNTKRGD